MKQLIFMYNYMLSDKWQEKSKLPFTFISFGYIEGKLYRIEDNYIALDEFTSKKHKWSDDRIYGAFFLLDEAQFYMRTLDGIMGCSLTSLRKNHTMDYMHRQKVEVTPIHFDTIIDFAQLKYIEKEPVTCYTYVANMDNKFINKKVNNTYRNRIRCGYDEKCFINLLLKYKKIT
ncbi:MAG TPA: hypothetical protein VLM92_15465 [Romboutsia sp.]|nr:hypothetical protein [Romboutsia sp.]